MNKSQFSNMNSVVRSDDFKFNQIQREVKIQKSENTTKQHYRRDTPAFKLAGWVNSSKLQQGLPLLNQSNIERISPVRPHPIHIDLKSREFIEINYRAIQSSAGTNSKRKPLRGLNFSKDMPSIIVHDTWFD
jgi:hypothetical protein